eukprot:264450_1
MLSIHIDLLVHEQQQHALKFLRPTPLVNNPPKSNLSSNGVVSGDTNKENIQSKGQNSQALNDSSLPESSQKSRLSSNGSFKTPQSETNCDNSPYSRSTQSSMSLSGPDIDTISTPPSSDQDTFKCDTMMPSDDHEFTFDSEYLSMSPFSETSIFSFDDCFPQEPDQHRTS